MEVEGLGVRVVEVPVSAGGNRLSAPGHGNFLILSGKYKLLEKFLKNT